MFVQHSNRLCNSELPQPDVVDSFEAKQAFLPEAWFRQDIVKVTICMTIDADRQHAVTIVKGPALTLQAAALELLRMTPTTILCFTRMPW